MTDAFCGSSLNDCLNNVIDNEEPDWDELKEVPQDPDKQGQNQDTPDRDEQKEVHRQGQSQNTNENSGVFNSLIQILSFGSDNNTNRDIGKYQDDTNTDVESNVGTDGAIRAMVFMISGCEDSQTSADVSNVSNFSLPNPNGRAGGACTSALLKGKKGTQRTTWRITFVPIYSSNNSYLPNLLLSLYSSLLESQGRYGFDVCASPQPDA